MVTTNDRVRFFHDLINFNFYSGAIDTYRPKYCNTHIICAELSYICSGMIDGHITNSNYLTSSIDEALDKIKEDSVLYKYYPEKRLLILDILSKVKSEKTSTEYLRTFLSKDVIPLLEKKYLKCLEFELIELLKYKEVFPVEEKELLVKIFDNLISELLYRGVSFNYIKAVLLTIKKGSSVSVIKNILSSFAKQRKYTVYLRAKCDASKSVLDDIALSLNKGRQKNVEAGPKMPVKEERFNSCFTSSGVQKRWSNKDRRSYFFWSKKVISTDRYAAVIKLKSQVEDILKFTHIKFPNTALSLDYTAIVYDRSEKRLIQVFADNARLYEMATTESNYKKLLEEYVRLSKVSETVVFRKISNSISHLNFSLNDFNLINKYLNSWISLEVLFNTLDENTVASIYKYIPQISSLFYYQKLISDLAEKILYFCSDTKDPYFDDFKNEDGTINTIFLLNVLANKEKKNFLLTKTENTYLVYLINKFSEYSLNKEIPSLLKAHEKRLLQQLTRLYRIRNDLVHNASLSISTPLYQISSLIFLTNNIQHYSLSIIEKILEMSRKNSFTNLNQIFESYALLFDKLNFAFKNNDIKIKKLMDPLSL